MFCGRRAEKGRTEMPPLAARASEVGALVKKRGCVTGGHGLFLVQSLADQWGYVRDQLGTTVWFWLAGAA